MAGMSWVSGDPWRICDVCGFKYRRSETFKRWDNLIVCSEDWEQRHPQDFVRGRVDRQIAREARPDPLITVIGPLTTTVTVAANPGDVTISVASSVRFGGGDHIGVTLSSGDVIAAIVQSVPSATSITVTAALPGAVPVGSVVTNYSAVSEPSL